MFDSVTHLIHRVICVGLLLQFPCQTISKCSFNLFLVIEPTGLVSFSDLQCHACDQGQLETVEMESGNGKQKWSNCYSRVKASLSGHLLKTTFYKDHLCTKPHCNYFLKVSLMILL